MLTADYSVSLPTTGNLHISFNIHCLSDGFSHGSYLVSCLSVGPF